MAGLNKGSACFFTALLLMLALAFASSVQAERLPIKIYTAADGLANNRVIRIVRDSRGFLWFCTAEGLSRFDGYGFTSYGMEQGLPAQTINDLIQTREGVYWVATEGGGVCRFNPSATSSTESRFTAYHLDEGQANEVYRLFEDRGGRIWAGSMGGLFRLDQPSRDGAQFRRVDLNLTSQQDRLTKVWAFAEDSEGTLWIGHSFGLNRHLPGGRMIHYSIEPVQEADYVWSLLIDREGRLWIGHESGMIVLKPEPVLTTSRRVPWLRLNESPPFEEESISGPICLPLKPGDACRHAFAAASPMFQSATSPLMMGTGGLTVLDGDRFHSYTKANGLIDSPVITLTQDSDENLWMGTQTGGAMRLAQNGFITYTKADGLHSDGIVSIFETQDGVLCTTNYNWRVNSHDGRRFIATRLNLPGRVVDPARRFYRAAMQDHAGEWWIPTDEGLYRFPKVSRVEQLARSRPKAVYTTRQGLASNNLLRTFEDSRGDIWIGSSSPNRDVITRWDRATDSFHIYGKSDGLPSFKLPISFVEDDAGNLWIGYLEGDLARFRNGRFELITEIDHLQPGSINSFHLDGARRLWIGTGRGGLLRVDDPGAEQVSFTAYTTANGLSSNGVRCVAEDRWGNIYAGTSQGLDRLNPETGRSKHYTSADGLVINEVNFAFRDRAGTLWFGTRQGLSRLIPAPDQPKSPPPILISGLRIAGSTYPVSDLGEIELSPLELAASQNQIEIDFFGLSFNLGEALRYQYKLEGSEDEWKPLTNLRSVNYANLSPGAYRFMVRAVGSDGVGSQSPATFNFTILPQVWRRWWFITLAAILIIAIFVALDRYRAARVRAIKESEDRFRTLAQTASDAIITIDEQSRIIFVNPAAENVFGYTAAEMLGRDLTMLMPEYLRHLHKAGFGKYVETGQRHLSWEAIELPGLHKSGREVPLEISFGEFTRNENRFFTGVARDITERKRAEEALRKSREERLVELEHVRRRIATDLHDDIGSSLSQIFLLSEVARQRVGRDDSPAMEPLSMIANASHDLVASMSDIVWAINPHKDHLSDLVLRMRRFASDTFSARNIEFDFRAPDDEQDTRLGASIRREVFLIFKESVNNIVRHSDCRRAEIEFSLLDDSIELRLSDNGKGFDVSLESEGHGLFSMRERAKAIGGELEMNSSCGRGTTIRLKVMLDQSGQTI